MTWAVAGTSILSVGLALTVAVLAIRIGGLKERAIRLANDRDSYARAVAELQDELTRRNIGTTRDTHVLEGKIQRCREAINALPESSFSRGLVLSELDELLQGEDP